MTTTNIIFINFCLYPQVICRFGCPEVLITDQGREFVNHLSSKLYNMTNTDHRITSAYHPQVIYDFQQEFSIAKDVHFVFFCFLLVSCMISGMSNYILFFKFNCSSCLVVIN